ncbi:MAG TPA: potassium/proton antiporter [Nocardioidaceae bacterium]|nr:potassium/proton antiporter [Nocardioidaceae bacterium]
MNVGALDQVLLVGAVVVLLAILAVRGSVFLGLPSLLAYLGMGLILGEAVIGLRFDDPSTAHALGFAALAVILAEGGLTTRWSEVRPSIGVGLTLATVGVVISTAVVGAVVHLVLGVNWRTAFLLGAVVSPTDAAAVFTVLRRVPLRSTVRGALESESGLNDAVAVILVTLLTSGLSHSAGVMVGLVCYELVGGIVFGALVGAGGVWLLRRVALPVTGLYPASVLAIAILSYAGGAAIHASGFAAIYVTALVLGNGELPHRLATRSFAEGFAWLAQIGLFVMLGLITSPQSFRLEHLVGGVVAGAVVTLVARPVSVAICTIPFRVPWRSQSFLSVAGLRGAVPIVLATVPLAAHATGSRNLFNVVFVLVVVLTLVQGPALPRVAGRLRVLVERSREVDVDAAPLEGLAADLLHVHVTAGSLLHGVEVGELRLPRGVSISLVVREGTSFTPGPGTPIRHGDDLLVVTPRRLREAAENRLQEISRGGRLAGWLRVVPPPD